MKRLLIAVLVAIAACSRGPAAPALLPVTLPDMSRMDKSVQEQARARYAVVTGQSSQATAVDRAEAYGRLGMVLHAAEYVDSAEPCYLNAQTLAPDDRRWPYYLGHLYRTKGDMAKAEAAFTRALQLQADDVATLVWLARSYLDDGKPVDAEPLFQRARQQAPRSAAVLGGLGQAALAQRHYDAAVAAFEEALTADPGAQSVHSPLAAAYRALGRTSDAEEHLKRWRNTDLLVPDPLKEELDLLLESALSYELRGVRALERDPKTAASLFRQGIPLAPENSQLLRSLHHKLGTALYLSGDLPGALAQFEQVVRMAPPDGVDESTAKAHYSLGVVMASSGRDREALEHLAAAVKYQPTYAEARLAYADALRRARRYQEALAEYAETVRINPRAAEARFGYAMALVSLHRYRDARDWLTESVRVQPDRLELPHALARILAAAPDDSVRDGRQAMTIVQDLLQRDKSTELGATMAMAYAEIGEFQQAAQVQRDVIEASQRAGLSEAVRRLTVDLRRYERNQPCRTPWQPDDPVNVPGPPVGG